MSRQINIETKKNKERKNPYKVQRCNYYRKKKSTFPHITAPKHKEFEHHSKVSEMRVDKKVQTFFRFKSIKNKHDSIIHTLNKKQEKQLQVRQSSVTKQK